MSLTEAFVAATMVLCGAFAVGLVVVSVVTIVRTRRIGKRPAMGRSCEGESGGGAPMTGLTQRQREVLDVIVAHFNEHGVYPTFRELGARLGIGSLNGINDHLRFLERKGFIRKANKQSRSMLVVRTSDGVAVRARLVPELGEVSAGVEQAATVAIPVFRSLSGMRAGGER